MGSLGSGAGYLSDGNLEQQLSGFLAFVFVLEYVHTYAYPIVSVSLGNPGQRNTTFCLSTHPSGREDDRLGWLPHLSYCG